MNFQKPKGTADLLYPESVKWQYVESVARHLFSTYQFHEVRTPIFEHYEVFARSVGDSSDIVSKEMYDFYDKGDRHITLRPEGTAGVVRAFVEHKLYGPDQPNPYKSYYIGPMFRYERPQSGRFRQFHQIGVEVFGVQNPAVDVETMALALSFFQTLGAKHLKLVINSLGDKETRDAYRQALIDYLTPYTDKLSYDSQKRLLQNPLRVLDSKDKKDKEIVQNAPSILDYLSEDSQHHFEQVKVMLDAIGIDYEVDNRMVRGLDYYTHTIFEIMSDAPGFGAITTVCAGGRYDGLVQELGGPEVPGIGFAIGLERVLITLEAEGITLPIDESIDIFVVGLGEATNSEALKLVQTARFAGLSAERDYLGKKAKAQFKLANKLSASHVLTIGEDELAASTVNIKNMATGNEQLVSLDAVYEDIRTTIESV